MITLETLKKFTYPSSSTSDIRNAYLIDNFTVATDGHILVVVPYSSEYGELRSEVRDSVRASSLKFIDEHKNESYLTDTEKHLIEPVEPLPENTCEACHGTGWSDECPECDGSGTVEWESDNGYNYSDDCGHEFCRGGKIDRIKLKETIDKGETNADYCPLPEDCSTCKNPREFFQNRDLGVQRFNGGLLNKIVSNLGNATLYASTKNELTHTHFTFNGGFGVIMPMIKKIYNQITNNDNKSA